MKLFLKAKKITKTAATFVPNGVQKPKKYLKARNL
jgi:hypothetical protein